MKRIPLIFRVSFGLIAGAAVVSAQVPLEKEPHHKVLLDTLLLRILDVTVQPGEMTLEHRHEYDIATVALGSASTRTKPAGEDWGQPRTRPVGSADLAEYTGKPGVHTVENPDKTPYRLIAVENYRTGSWPTRKSVTAPGTTLTRESRSFAAYDIKLTAAEPKTEHSHDVPAVLVLVSGEVTNQGTNGEEPQLVRGEGTWLLVPAAQSHAMQVGGSGNAHIVEIEVR